MGEFRHVAQFFHSEAFKISDVLRRVNGPLDGGGRAGHRPGFQEVAESPEPGPDQRGEKMTETQTPVVQQQIVVQAPLGPGGGATRAVRGRGVSP